MLGEGKERWPETGVIRLFDINEYNDLGRLPMKMELVHLRVGRTCLEGRGQKFGVFANRCDSATFLVLT